MKIMLYVNSHLPDIGGRELVVHNLALQFQAKGHDVVVAGAAGFRRHANIRFEYPVVRWPVLGMAEDASRMVAFTAHQLGNRYDVVHPHVTYPCGYIATKMRWATKAPIVITPHGEDINVIPEINFGQRLDPRQAPQIEYAVGHADLLTAISETVYNSILDTGAPAERVVRIPNGVDMARFASPVSADLEAALGIPAASTCITSIGNFHPRKGHRALVDSMKIARQSNSNLHLVIVGRTSDEFCGEVSREGCDEFVTFTGPLSVPSPMSDEPDLLAALLQKSAIYVSSSIDEGAEGLSLALFESMAAEACPIVTNISGNRDIIDEGRNGRVVEPGNADALAQAIVEVAGDEATRSRLAAAARETASAYGWDVIADQYLENYQRAIHTKENSG